MNAAIWGAVLVGAIVGFFGWFVQAQGTAKPATPTVTSTTAPAAATPTAKISKPTP
ncbi:MAG TPA: hypothetical protein VFQ88_05900 [Nevskiaceae bacterium]|nr:hypothetical protein [Nevskiaceae bacterium]